MGWQLGEHEKREWGGSLVKMEKWGWQLGTAREGVVPQYGGGCACNPVSFVLTMAFLPKPVYKLVNFRSTHYSSFYSPILEHYKTIFD